MEQHLDEASDCLRALFRGEESQDAFLGGMLLAKALARLTHVSLLG